MKVNFGSFLNVVLTDLNTTWENRLVFDYARKKVISQRVFHNGVLTKAVHENGFTNYSPKSGKPMLVFFENARKRISHAFSKKTERLTRFVKKDKLSKTGYYAKFNENGQLRSVTVFAADKNACKSKYFLNENGDVIKIKRKKPNLNGDLAIKYNPDTDEIEFIQKNQHLSLKNGLFRKEETYFNNDFGGKLVRKVTKELDNSGSMTTETSKYSQKDNKVYLYEYIMSNNKTLHPVILETFDSIGKPALVWSVETAHKSPQPQFFTIAGHNLCNKPVDISKIALKDYYELISSKNFIKNRIKYSDTMNK